MSTNEENLDSNNDHRKTILIFGLSSFIGSNLAEFLKKDYKVVGTYNRNPVVIPGVLAIPCDVLQKDQVQFACYTTKPDIAIYCVGLSSVKDCSETEELADALNTVGLFNISEICQRYKSQLCYISSGHVFSGEKKKYMESDIPDSNTFYGRTQASAEFYIQKTSLNYLIFRCCKLYGRTLLPHRTTWFEVLEKRLKLNQRLGVDNYIWFGFLDIMYLGMLIKLCIQKNAKNRLFQVCSSDTMTFFEFAEKYKEIFDVSSSSNTKSRWDYPLLATAAPSISGEYNYDLDVVNIESYLNIDLPNITESIEQTFKRLKGGASKNKRDNKDNKGKGINYI
jgi:dTDP-4-dehydrorhamnose reductase